MSELQPPSTAAHGAAEKDRLPYARILLAMVVVLGLFSFSVFVMWRIEVGATLFPPAPIPLRLGQPEIHQVDQWPFDKSEQRSRKSQRERYERLNGFGWVDRDAGVVHIPIEEAMDLMLSDGGTP
jgi:hypothetical protein